MEAAAVPGGCAVDATVGNGHDTVFLARQVGPAGRVYGFDVQEAALTRARQRLAAAGLQDRTVLYCAGHEALASTLPRGCHGHVHVVAFNLGYLPGGVDPVLVTRPETTIPALEQAVAVLAPGGLVTVVLYPGHAGGREEAEAVRCWAAALDPGIARTATYHLLNQPNDPPRLIVVEKGNGRAVPDDP